MNRPTEAWELGLGHGQPMRPGLVSVVLPTYDRQAATQAALESVRAQRDVEVEAIVVDDGSTRPFRAIEGRSTGIDLSIVRHDRNKGVAAAQNSGLRRASGEFIYFLHSDDRLADSRSLARLVNNLRIHSEAGGVEGALLIVDSVGQLTYEPPRLRSLGTKGIFSLGHGVHISALLFRRAALVSLPFDEELRCWEDFDLLHRFVQDNSLSIDEGPVAIICDSPTPGRLSASRHMTTSLRILLGKHRGELSSDSRLYARWRFELARREFLGGELQAGRRDLFESMRSDPRTWRRLPLLIASHLGPRSLQVAMRVWRGVARARTQGPTH